MVVYVVDVRVKLGFGEDFLKATQENHLATRKEKGNIRFDVLQSADDLNQFVLYEAYASAEAVDAHKKTEHYLKWRQKVEAWMEKPRSGKMFNVGCWSD